MDDDNCCHSSKDIGMSLPSPKIVFLLPAKAAELDRLREYHPDIHIPLFATGVMVWTVQTYIRLRDAGFPVELASVPPTRGIALVHADFGNWLLRTATPESDLHVVVMRADRGASANVDSEIVQNRHSADGRRAYYIQHWPQPGLKPRDPARGSHLTVATFKGHVSSMHPYLRTSDWDDDLARIGIRWRAQNTEFVSSFVVKGTTDWHDYESIDAIVGLRPDRVDDYPNKPASKLVNAWHAGVPAILGPEIAYRELRRTNLDFIEVASPSAAVRALENLRRSPETYRAMIANGCERARQFSVDSVVEEWGHFIEFVLKDFDTPTATRARRENAIRRRTASDHGSPARSGWNSTR
jgi:hypothetical protein